MYNFNQSQCFKHTAHCHYDKTIHPFQTWHERQFCAKTFAVSAVHRPAFHTGDVKNLFFRDLQNDSRCYATLVTTFHNLASCSFTGMRKLRPTQWRWTEVGQVVVFADVGGPWVNRLCFFRSVLIHAASICHTCLSSNHLLASLLSYTPVATFLIRLVVFISVSYRCVLPGCWLMSILQLLVARVPVLFCFCFLLSISQFSCVVSLFVCFLFCQSAMLAVVSSSLLLTPDSSVLVSVCASLVYCIWPTNSK